MWKSWTTGILGILVMLIPYLLLDSTMQRMAMVLLGLIIAVLSFWTATKKDHIAQ